MKDEWQRRSIFKLLYFKVGHCVSKCVLDVFIMGFHGNIVVLWEPLVNWPISLQTGNGKPTQWETVIPDHLMRMSRYRSLSSCCRSSTCCTCIVLANGHERALSYCHVMSPLITDQIEFSLLISYTSWSLFPASDSSSSEEQWAGTVKCPGDQIHIFISAFRWEY